jgi:SAM-dependent methyltransferase
MNNQYTDKFYSNREGTLTSARHIVPLILQYLPVKSVVDIGCGLGEFLNVFAENGATKVLGVDGPWVKRDRLLIRPEDFLEADLTKPFQQSQPFDLAISCEVGEHLPEPSADTFVKSLTGLGNVVLFSAAIPLQGGTFHVNEQWPEYWATKFEACGFVAIDCLRLAIWNNPEIRFWYKQNLLLFVRQESLANYPALRAQYEPGKPVLPLVHPHIFGFYARSYRKITGWVPSWAKGILKTFVKI